MACAQSNEAEMTDAPQAQEEKKKPWAAPLAAILSAVGSLVCCLPLALVAAFGAAGASAIFTVLRPWLLALSAALLIIGFLQLYRGGKSCRRRSIASVVLFWIAVAIFLAMLFFPQQIAGLLAGHLGS
jgi:hypothetical protein